MKFHILLILLSIILLIHATPPRNSNEMKRWSVEWPEGVNPGAVDIGQRLVRALVLTPDLPILAEEGSI